MRGVNSPIGHRKDFPASYYALSRRSPIFNVSSGNVLLLLGNASGILGLCLAIASRLYFRSLVVSLRVALGFMSRFSITSLVLPFQDGLTVSFARKDLVEDQSFIVIVGRATCQDAPIMCW